MTTEKCTWIIDPPNILEVEPYQSCDYVASELMVAPNSTEFMYVAHPYPDLNNIWHPTYNFGTNDVSMEMWFYPTQRDGFSATRHRGTSTSYHSIGVRDGQLGATYYAGFVFPAHVYYVLDWGPIGNVRRWRYIAANFIKSTNEMWVNVDGTWAGPIPFAPLHAANITPMVLGSVQGAAMWSAAIHENHILTDRDIKWSMDNQDTNAFYGDTITRLRFVDIQPTQPSTINYVPWRVASISGLDGDAQWSRFAPPSNRAWSWWDQTVGDGVTTPVLPRDPTTGDWLRYNIDFDERPELHDAFPNACIEGWIANSTIEFGPIGDVSTRLIVPDSSAKASDQFTPWDIPVTYNSDPRWARPGVVDTGVRRTRLFYLPNDYKYLPSFPGDWTD